MSRSRNRSRCRRKRTAVSAAPVTLQAAPADVPAAAPAEEGKVFTRPQAVAQILAALDGYSNAAAFLGDDSPLISSGTFRRSGLTDRTELLTVTYRENWIAKRIIDMPSEDMTRAWYRPTCSLPEDVIDDTDVR